MAAVAAPSTAAPSDRRLARNVGLLGVGQLITWTCTLAWNLVVPRLIGPDGMGLITMSAAAAGILAGLAGLGSRPMLVKEIAANPSRAPQLLGTAFLVRTALVLPCAGLTALYIHLAGFGGVQAVALYLAVGLAAFTLLAEVIQAGLQGIERMGYLAGNDVVNKGLQAVLSIPLAAVGLAALWLIGLQVAVAGLLTGLNLVWGRRFHIDWRLSGGRMLSFLRSSLAYWAYALFFTFYLWLDSTLLSLMTTERVVGWYGVPTRAFQTLMFLPVILSTAWLPRLSAAYGRSPQELKRAARMPLEMVFVLSLPIAAGVALVARPVILLVYGPAFEASVPVLEILAVTCVPMYLNIVLSQVLTASNRQTVWTWAMMAASVLNLALNLVLIRYFQATHGNGAIGAALSMLGTEAAIVAMGIWVIRDFIDVAMVGRLARGVLATAGMAVVGWYAARIGLWAELLGCGVTFLLLALLLRVISREEWAELARLAGRRRGPA
jgi:O-antigen/teichoic acid export membrane protein